MNALSLHINKLLDNGFAESAYVHFQSVSSEPWTQLGKRMHDSKRFYVTQVKSNMGDETVFEQAYNINGDYIGSVKDAEYICGEKQINPEPAKSTHSVCSIGQADDGRWWGWSHRAMSDFSTREEAVKFAESVSSSTISEAIQATQDSNLATYRVERNGKLFESESARKVNVAQCSWVRYNGTKKMRLSTEHKDTFSMEKGDIMGVRYNQKQDRIELFYEEALDLAFLPSERQLTEFTKSIKPYKGKVDNKKVTPQRDWLIPSQRKAYDKANAKEQPKPKTPKTPKTPKEPKAPKSGSSREPKAAVSKLPKLDKFAWYKITGKCPRLATMENGEKVTVDLDPNDVIGIRYAEDTNEILVVLEEMSDLQFPITLQALRKYLSVCTSWSGKVRGMNGRASKATANAIAKYWVSREFTSEYNGQQRAIDNSAKAQAEREFIDSVDVDKDGYASSKRESRAIEKELNSGNTVWFAAGVTNTAREKANVVFGESKKEVVARLKPLMHGNASDEITTGVVSTAHGIYREYVEAGERKSGLPMHAGRIQPLIRDSKEGTVSSTKLGRQINQEVTVPEFNENLDRENIEKAPVFKGNDVEVLMQIQNLVTSRKAFTAAYVPLPKLKEIKAGKCLLLQARHNNERYRVEGTRVINRIRRFYGTKAITGAFKEVDSNLYLVIYLARVAAKSANGSTVEQTKEVRERALKIRQFMTNQTPEKQESAQEDARKVKQLTARITSDEAKVRELESARDTLRSALAKRKTKLDQAKADGSSTEQHQAKVDEYGIALADLTRRIATLDKQIEDGREQQASIMSIRKDQRSVVDSVYMTKDGEQVVIVKANYQAGELIVSPIKGSKANYDRKIPVHELYDLGGKQVL